MGFFRHVFPSRRCKRRFATQTTINAAEYIQYIRFEVPQPNFDETEWRADVCEYPEYYPPRSSIYRSTSVPQTGTCDNNSPALRNRKVFLRVTPPFALPAHAFETRGVFREQQGWLLLSLVRDTRDAPPPPPICVWSLDRYLPGFIEGKGFVAGCSEALP